MRFVTYASLLGVIGSLIVAACGSSDTQKGEPGHAGDGGRGGEPGASGGLPSMPRAGSAGAGAEPGDAGTGGDVFVGNDGGGGAVLGGAGGLAGAGGAAADTVVDFGFDGADTLPANLDPGTAVLTPSQGYAELGPEGNKFGTTFLRGPTGTVITLTLSDLPPHTTLSLSLLFAAIDSLDGTGEFPAGDFFNITLDGVSVFRESFANATADQIQSYAPPAAAVLARRVDLGFQGPGGFYTDSAYDFGQDPRFQGLPHAASSAVLVFTLEGGGVQTIDDESWAIDNLRVTVQ